MVAEEKGGRPDGEQSLRRTTYEKKHMQWHYHRLYLRTGSYGVESATKHTKTRGHVLVAR